MGQGHARADARRPPHGLGCPVRAGGPAGHASSPRTRPASRTGRTRPGPADPGAALVDGSAVRPSGRESPADPEGAGAAAASPARGGGPGHARLGPWEVWLAGIVVAGRTRPIGWAVAVSLAQRPIPCHDHRAHPAVAGRLSTWGALDPGRGPRLSACGLFAQWRHGGPGLSVRLRLSDWVTVAGVYAMVAVHVETGRLVDGQRTAAARGRGRPDQPLVPGWVV